MQPQFITPVNIPEAAFRISYSDKLLFIGSCFTENIGNRFAELGFTTCINPFGIVYNPISLFDSLLRIYENKNYISSDLFEHQGLWHSPDHHGRFSKPNKAEALNLINTSLAEASDFLKNCSVIIITLGTSFVYQAVSSGKIVANCHKLPASSFHKRLLSVKEIISAFDLCFHKFRNSGFKFRYIFTLSPVRHINDGLIENQRSKATALLAIHEIVAKYEDTFYFPAYEILLDELRDYRFYADDMIHPSALASEIIANKFIQNYLKPELQPLLSEIQNIIKASRHRPFNADSDEYKTFCHKQLTKAKELMQLYPEIKLGQYVAFFENQIGK